MVSEGESGFFALCFVICSANCALLAFGPSYRFAFLNALWIVFFVWLARCLVICRKYVRLALWFLVVVVMISIMWCHMGVRNDSTLIVDFSVCLLCLVAWLFGFVACVTFLMSFLSELGFAVCLAFWAFRMLGLSVPFFRLFGIS